MLPIKAFCRNILLGACFIATIGCLGRKKPINLTTAQERVEAYYESGKFDQEFDRVIRRAKKHFFKIPVTDEALVVFDIDDTLLSSYHEVKKIHFGYVPKLSHEWMMRADAPAIRQVKELYDYIVNRGFHIVFITGRSQSEYQATVKNLADVGFGTYDRLVFRAPDEQSLTAELYKTQRRKQLATEGYNIVASIGDQWSDLCGPDSGYRVKIPNYLYIIR